MLRDGEAPEPYREGCNCARYVRLTHRIARLPPMMMRAPLGITCPHCGYRGETAVEDQSYRAHFFPGFRVQQLLYVYHDIVTAAVDRGGTLFHFFDSGSMEIPENETIEATNIECGNCDQTFPWSGPIWSL